MKLLIDTCVLPRNHLEETRVYTESFGDQVSFELLPMFDLPGFEDNLRENLLILSGRTLFFHEPVWDVEHTASKGSSAYEKSMYHIMLTRKYADLLHPQYMVYHLNNCPIPPAEKSAKLQISLQNMEEIRALFPNVRLLLENTGSERENTALLNQTEFTTFCLDRHMEVLIDVGHANINGWDIPLLIHDLKSQIRGYHLHNNNGLKDSHSRLREGTICFETLIPYILETTPDAALIIEYIQPVHHGQPLLEDIDMLLNWRSLWNKN